MWGANSCYQQGNGNTEDVKTPKVVDYVDNVDSISMSAFTSSAITDDGGSLFM